MTSPVPLSCRYGVHAKAVLPWVQEVDFCLGWLHSKAGHRLDCQLKFCSMYRAQAGRAPLECMEQVFVSTAVAPRSSVSAPLSHPLGPLSRSLGQLLCHYN